MKSYYRTLNWYSTNEFENHNSCLFLIRKYSRFAQDMKTSEPIWIQQMKEIEISKFRSKCSLQKCAVSFSQFIMKLFARSWVVHGFRPESSIPIRRKPTFWAKFTENNPDTRTVVCLKSGLQKIRTFAFLPNRACPKNPDFYVLAKQGLS